jgi:hypothetical protein
MRPPCSLSESYLLSRTLGDVNAAKRGPSVLAKRLVRRSLTRSLFRALGNGGRR